MVNPSLTSLDFVTGLGAHRPRQRTFTPDPMRDGDDGAERRAAGQFVIGEGRAEVAPDRSRKSGTLWWDTDRKKSNDQVEKLASHCAPKRLNCLKAGTPGDASILL